MNETLACEDGKKKVQGAVGTSIPIWKGSNLEMNKALNWMNPIQNRNIRVGHFEMGSV